MKLTIILLSLLILNINCHKKVKTEKYIWVINTDGANLMSEPSTKSNNIKLISFGTKLIILSELKRNKTTITEKNKWIKIKCDDNKGWVMAKFLSKNPIIYILM